MTQPSRRSQDLAAHPATAVRRTAVRRTAVRRTAVRRTRGVALIALLAAILVLELAALAAVPLASTARERSDEAELKCRLLAYRRALERYKEHFHQYPARLEDLLQLPPNPRMLRSLYPDPLVQDGNWSILRQPDGNLISGVRSTSTERALDGSRYIDWEYDLNYQFTSRPRLETTPPPPTE